MAIRRILVEDKIGALTFFATINHALFGLTAGHVLTGDDNHVDRDEGVFMFEDINGNWLSAGQSVSSQFSRDGRFIPDDFGTLDVGLFSLINEFKVYIADKLKKLLVHPAIINKDFQSLLGLRVFSYSVMYKKTISATISEIFSHSDVGNPYDLIIDSDDNELITTQGDSGILWYDVHGFAVGMHTNGNAVESNTSYATLINRVINVFQIEGIYVL